MNRHDMIKSLEKIISQKREFIGHIKRKRKIRDSERVMSIGAVGRDIEALSYAISLIHFEIHDTGEEK